MTLLALTYTRDAATGPAIAVGTTWRVCILRCEVQMRHVWCAAGRPGWATGRPGWATGSKQLQITIS